MASAQVNVSIDTVPDFSSKDSVAVANNNMRLNQNAINAIGGYFNSNGYLTESNGGTGANLSALPNGSILVQNTANVGIGTFGQGTTGQFVQSQGPGVNPTWASTTWVPTNIQVFTANGTWTKPAGVSTVYVKAWGAGAGAGGASANNAIGGGGGSCAYSEGFIAVTGNVSVGIGTYGVGGNGANAGTDGGNATFAGTTTLTAGGGKGGDYSDAATHNGVGGLAGTASNGQINLVGNPGMDGSGAAAASTIYGAGAPGFSFGGPAGVVMPTAATNTTGSNGQGYCAGGTGGARRTANGQGGNGAPAIVMIYY